MIAYQAPAYRPFVLAQAVEAPPSPVPAVAPAPKRVSTPLILGIGLVGGTVLGFLGSILAQRLDKRMQQGGTMRKFGAIGGAIGGLLGAGTALALKD